MEQLLKQSVNSLVAFIFLFIIIMSLIAYLFVGKEVLMMYLGFLKTLLSVITAPFQYLKNVMKGFTEVGKFGDKTVQRSEQLLLNKIVNYLGLLSAVGVVFIFSVGIISSWKTLMPPDYLFERREQVKVNIESKTLEYDTLKLAHTARLADFNSKKDSMMKAFSGSQKKEQSLLVKKNKSIETRLLADTKVSQDFKKIQDYLTENEANGSRSTYYETYEKVVDYVNRTNHDQSKKDDLIAYASNWQNYMDIEWGLSTFDENLLQKLVYPDWFTTEQTLNSYLEQISRLHEKLNRVEEQIEYDFSGMLLVMLYHFLYGLIFLWISGVILQSLNLSLDIATNIRRLRELKEGQKDE